MLGLYFNDIEIKLTRAKKIQAIKKNTLKQS